MFFPVLGSTIFLLFVFFPNLSFPRPLPPHHYCRLLLQVLAALQFSRQTEGIWFLDPQAWVSNHLFKEASIWDIPLVKPRYTCSIDPMLLRNNTIGGGDDGSRVGVRGGARGSFDVAEVLTKTLNFLSMGGKCPTGQVDF